jgi:energy-coupling factor transport system ATP-binding protein
MVALIGRNGAGKSTMLRHIAGLLEPTRGRVEVTGQASLLLQNPGDYFLAERVDGETTATDLERFGLRGLESRHPRELSGGQQQRLALAIVCAGQAPAVLCLDEPTRGMDRGAKSDLAEHLHELSGHGTAVLVATHDAEFAAAVAQRVVLLADGRVIADGSAQELLAGGWYFATETARVLGGAALLPDDGALMLRRRLQDAGARAERAGSVP